MTDLGEYEGFWIRHGTVGVSVLHIFPWCGAIKFHPEQNEFIEPEQALRMGFKRICRVCQ